MAEGASVRMEIDGSTLIGQGPCNRHVAKVEADGTSLRIEDARTDTGAHCMDRVVDDEPYLEALGRIGQYLRDEDRLVLMGQDTKLAYEQIPPVPDEPLVGTEWTLHTMFEGSRDDPNAAAAEVATEAGDEPTLMLHDGGRFTAHTGCREVVGRWEHQGSDLRFSEAETGEGACPDRRLEGPDEAQRDVFGARMKVRIEGRSLYLWAEDGPGLDYATDPASSEQR